MTLAEEVAVRVLGWHQFADGTWGEPCGPGAVTDVAPPVESPDFTRRVLAEVSRRAIPARAVRRLLKAALAAAGEGGG